MVLCVRYVDFQAPVSDLQLHLSISQGLNVVAERFQPTARHANRQIKSILHTYIHFYQFDNTGAAKTHNTKKKIAQTKCFQGTQKSDEFACSVLCDL